MLNWLARRVVKDAWFVVGAWALIAVVLASLALVGVGGRGLFDRLEAGSASVTGSESAQGQEILDTLAGDGETVTLLVRGVDLSDTSAQEAIATALGPAHEELAALVGEENVIDPFVVPGMLTQEAARALASTSLDGFLIIVTVDPNGDAVAAPDDEKHAADVAELVSRVEARLSTVPDDLTAVAPGVTGIVSDDGRLASAVNDQVERDLLKGELISIPLALLVMVLVFGGFLAAGMPILGALVSVAGSLGVLFLLSLVMDLQSFVVNITSVIGLGLSIDYGLLITSRYREELASSARAPTRQRRRRSGRRDTVIAGCMRTTVTTAGRTVLFSALTVAVSMVGLLLVGTDLLRSIALAGIAVVLIAVAAALTLIPAVLVLLGERMTRPSPLRRLPLLGTLQRHLGDVTSERGVFAWIARQVNRFPWFVLVACVAALLVLASPVRELRMLNSTTDLLPPDSDQRTYLSLLADDYNAAAEQDATMIIAGTGDSVATFINDEVARTPGVDRVLQSATAGDYTVVYLDLAGDAASGTAEDAVGAIRDLDAPADTWVTGQAASQLDFRSVILHGLPWVVGTVVLATFVLLFLMTGSLLVPLKALLINALSLAASMGVLVWVFQDGHLSGLLGFTPIGGVETYVVLTAVAVGFGLAMDYEVFLLARIKEYWDAGGDNDTAVERGLQRSGRIVTSAALIMVTVFAGFISGDLLVIKEIGFALAVIVALDATLVRMLLVPATMSLLGRWNWWAPARLRRVYERYGLDRAPAVTGD